MRIAFWVFSLCPFVKTEKVPKSFIFTLIFQLFYDIKKLKSYFLPIHQFENITLDFPYYLGEVIKKYLISRQVVDVDSYEKWRYFL